MEVTFRSGGVELHGYLHQPGGGGPGPAAVLCHPHPAGGGCMEVPLLRTVARRLTPSGVAVLRFDFRGVGESAGDFTDGELEVADVEAAVSYLLSSDVVHADRIALVGWSFGAWMALGAAARGLSIETVVAVAPPLAACDWEGYADDLTESSAVRYYVVGDSDRFCSAEELIEFASASGGDEEDVTVLPGADHFLLGKESEVASVVKQRLTGNP